MTRNIHELIAAVLKNQRHRDAIRDSRALLKHCEDETPDRPPCWILQDGQNPMSPNYYLCEACEENLEIAAEIRQLKTSSGGLAANVARLARLVLQEQGVKVSKREIANEIIRERAAQDAKWGEQNPPNGTSLLFYKTVSDVTREACDAAFKEGVGTWTHILKEEMYEAFAESDPERLRGELIQVAAVAMAWIEAIDRKSNA